MIKKIKILENTLDFSSVFFYNIYYFGEIGNKKHHPKLFAIGTLLLALGCMMSVLISVVNTLPGLAHLSVFMLIILGTAAYWEDEAHKGVFCRH